MKQKTKKEIKHKRESEIYRELWIKRETGFLTRFCKKNIKTKDNSAAYILPPIFHISTCFLYPLSIKEPASSNWSRSYFKHDSCQFGQLDR